MTPWGEQVADYLRLRRQLGFKLSWEEHLLGEFTEHLNAAGIQHLKNDVMIDWAGLPRQDAALSGASRALTRMRAVRSFAAYMHAVEPANEVPPRGVFVHRTHRTAPYIYTPAQITALLDAAAGLQRYERSRIYPVVFGLLAVTGMRVGEVLSMDADEVDLGAGIITVSRGKSRDPRLVPIHSTTSAKLAEYAAWRAQRSAASPADASAFFTDHRGRRLSKFTTEYAFQHVREIAGLTVGGAHPRMHDLRHTFAVTTMLGWYRNGLDVAGLVPRLSTYLGHINPTDTYWYLDAVPELLALAASRLDIAREKTREAES